MRYLRTVTYGKKGLSRTTRLAAILLVTLLSFSLELQAGAWTQDAGHGQIILNSDFFQTSTYFNESGATQKFSNDGHFRQFTVSSYLEYGLVSRYTLVLYVPAPFLNYHDIYSAQSSAGLGDVGVGIQKRLNKVESPWAISGLLTVSFPAYSATRNPPPGNHQEDIEGRFLIGRGTTCFKRHAFWDTQAGFRYRIGAPADQIRTDATVGIDLTKRLMVLGQFFGIIGLRNGEPLSITTNPNAQSDFDLYKCQLSMVARLTAGTRIQLGWNDAFAGRNAGRGQSIIFAVWKRF